MTKLHLWRLFTKYHVRVKIYRSRPRSITPEYDRHYYARSPERLRAVDRYDRAYGPPPGVPVHREYRREALPTPHHEYLARPPIHHGPPHIPPTHGYGPPRHSVPRPPFEKAENKKDKFS
jgi:RNA-binding protein 15